MKKNLITALKKLVTSFGGSAESNNAVDLVDEFADVAAQGGGGGGFESVIVTGDVAYASSTISNLSLSRSEIIELAQSKDVVLILNITSLGTQILRLANVREKSVKFYTMNIIVDKTSGVPAGFSSDMIQFINAYIDEEHCLIGYPTATKQQ